MLTRTQMIDACARTYFRMLRDSVTPDSDIGFDNIDHHVAAYERYLESADDATVAEELSLFVELDGATIPPAGDTNEEPVAGEQE